MPYLVWRPAALLRAKDYAVRIAGYHRQLFYGPIPLRGDLGEGGGMTWSTRLIGVAACPPQAGR